MSNRQIGTFYGWRVVQAAFVLALFGWGLGFYGPPVFLSVIHESLGWSIVLISSAISLHFLVGSLTGANLPGLHRRFGTSAVIKAGALAMAGAFADGQWRARRGISSSRQRSAASAGQR